MQEYIQSWYAFDAPDKRDFNFEWYAKDFAEWERVYKRPRDKVIIRDQWETPGCTRYWLRTLSNWQNINEYAFNWAIFNQVNPSEDWLISNKIKSLQAALKEFVKRNIIEGYLEIKKDANMIKNIRKAYSMWCYIYSGRDDAYRGIYKSPYNVQIRTDWKIMWHCYWMVDELEDWRHINSNSFWPTFWDKWYFYTPPKDIYWMFTLYAIVDKDDSWRFQDYKLKELARQTKEQNEKMYLAWDVEVKKKYEEAQLWKFLTKKYGL